MKRLNNLYEKIISIENLQLADAKARQGKQKNYGVMLHDRNREANIAALHDMLKNKTYRTSAYTTFTIYEPKERLISRLPYFPDRIVHHAVMNVMEQIFVSTFTADTYSCIKGRGIHGAANAIKNALKDRAGTEYCLKLDIQKFYPSINHEILKQLLRRKIKDPDLLWLLDEIIDSAPGLPIGNLLSQFFANYYLTPFDHWLKEVKRAQKYFRYLDDMVLLSGSKAELHQLLKDIRIYLQDKLKLTIKSNYQVFPVWARGIDVVGYVFFHKYTKLRKSIKQRFARMLARNRNRASIASYNGWTAHADCKHMIKKFLYE